MKSPARVLATALWIAALTPAQQRTSLSGSDGLAGSDWTVDGRPVTVPAAFETALGNDFDGVARYRRTFRLPAKATRRVRLEFDAVATHATVILNGIECGQHLGGWTPFRVDVTAAASWGAENVLEVVVDEKVGHNTQGFLPIIQPHFGGIWQDVTLCLDDGPVIDRHGLFFLGQLPGAQLAEGQRSGSWGEGMLRYRVPVLDESPGTELIVRVGDAEARSAGGNDGTLRVTNPEPWSPTRPTLYTVTAELRYLGRVVDRVERRVGFRDLRADGTTVLWNGSPFQMRGILHWGYSPPHLAPPTGREYWRRQLRDFKSLGFNCVKCCLWVPPRCFYELCDEIGLVVWQEYPTWHPQMDQAHKEELLTEYGEFFGHDRSHPSVAFRSITCETGHGADLDVVTALFHACKAACPDTLVVDDSSWIGWQRITDFWDEHPYGNNTWFPGRLEDFKKHIAEKGDKPLLLGEALAGDTWVDLDAFRAKHGDGDASEIWWQPWCWDAQPAIEDWLANEFDQATVDSLLPESRAFAMRNRKFQIEQLRQSIPDAGYVVSVARDFGKARMGFYDDQDELKWNADDWVWHRDTMICLVGGPSRVTGTDFADAVGVRVSHFGTEPLRGELRLWCADPPREVRVPLQLQPGEISAPIGLNIGLRDVAVARYRVHAELTGTHRARNAWEHWHVGRATPNVAGTEVVTELTPAVLDRLIAGARVLLLAGDRPGSVRTEHLWLLKGGPFAPAHSVHARVPVDLLLQLSSFDLESERLMPWEPWMGEVDPILAFWESHDIRDVKLHLQAFDTRVGKGRLLVTSLDLRGPWTRPGYPATRAGAGPFVESCFRHHLAHGPASKRALSQATIAALRGKLAEKKLDLPTWRFRMDPDDVGRQQNWHAPTTDVSGADWRDLQAGSHWENQGDDLKHFTGIGWYRVDVDIPADWQDLDVRAVFEGVDDSFDLWVDGEHLGSFGDPVEKVTIWLEQQVQELGRLTPGRHTIVLRVVDHAGAGGLWKPVFLTTGPIGSKSRLLH